MIHDSLRTKRFPSYLAALAAVFVVGVLGLWLHADVGTIVAIEGHLVALAGIALGAGAWHDRGVRVAALAKEVPASPPTPGGPPT